MDYRQKYKNWLTSSHIDEGTKQELLNLEGNDKEIEDRFYKNLEFGTGGLRGVIGAGSNRMNQYTVAIVRFGQLYLQGWGEGKRKRSSHCI